MRFFHLCFSLVIKVYKLYINVVMDSHRCEDARVCKSSNTPARLTKRRRCFKSPAGQPPAWKKRCFHSLCWGDFQFFSFILIFIDLHYLPAFPVKRRQHYILLSKHDAAYGPPPRNFDGTRWSLRTTISKGETIFWSNFVEFHVGFGEGWQIRETFMFTFRCSNMASWETHKIDM